MMRSKFKWLIVIQLLLNEQALCWVHPLAPRNSPLPGGDHEVGENVAKPAHQGRQLSSSAKSDPASALAHKKERIKSAEQIVSVLEAKLQGQIRDNLQIQRNVSCGELLAASTVDDPLSSMFPQELLGLSLVPVLVVAGCPQEAHTLVLRLYDLLGVADTEELLMEVEGLIERRMKAALVSAASTTGREEAENHIEAVMFNIQQLAAVGEATMGRSTPERMEHCEGWIRVNGTTLVGTVLEGTTGRLEEAVNTCERLGVLCAGVTSRGLHKPGKYQVVLKKDSRILPSESPKSESWIHQCNAEEASTSAAPGRRLKRSPQRSCINRSEQRVYNVMEWIPAVSTLYNLGTAVYYASVNCSETAKERAILSAVDLGTDALMVATGGTAGVAGYALGAGVKTGVKAGVKYLLNSMKQEDDVLVNQFSWEEGVFTIQ
ncbi:uncharacterized protein apof [Aulostomus maculatus]